MMGLNPNKGRANSSPARREISRLREVMSKDKEGGVYRTSSNETIYTATVTVSFPGRRLSFACSLNQIPRDSSRCLSLTGMLTPV